MAVTMPDFEPSFVGSRQVEKERDRLLAENKRLRDLLDLHGIPYQTGANSKLPRQKGISPGIPTVEMPAVAEDKAAETEASISHEPPHDAKHTHSITKYSATEEKIALYMSLFRGREDVYAKQWQSKDGKVGYSPACKNEWIPGICGKPKAKCASCAHVVYYPYDKAIINRHLRGDCVIGVYPLLREDACTFLAIDFDEADWRKDVCAVADVCVKYDVPHAIEISRSGNGAHLWFFFKTPTMASQARAFGAQLLTLAMQDHAKLNFSSYDRMFPGQDIMPKGGFGNLIALPLQKKARVSGGSVFVDRELHPYEDQWAFLASIRKIEKARLETYMSQWRTPPLGQLRAEEDGEDEEPWQRKDTALPKGECPREVHGVMADMLYIPMSGFSEKAKNRLKRLAAFRNPQFYQAQAMRMPVWNKPRVICSAEYRNDYLCLPRGCLEHLEAFADENDMRLVWQDERQAGKPIDVQFIGILREEQQPAFDALIAHDNGILSATTAFGKTVVGAALISEKHVNTLILVHRKQLLLQ